MKCLRSLTCWDNRLARLFLLMCLVGIIGILISSNNLISFARTSLTLDKNDPSQLSRLSLSANGTKRRDHKFGAKKVNQSTTQTKSGSAAETTAAAIPANNSTHSSNRKKYLFYVCDATQYCYGLGDRQRAIVGVYFLAEVTNRTFGLIMTSPANFTDYYRPNLVKWDIPKSELEGLSSTTLVSYGIKTSLKLDTIIFNNAYPQDIVYVYTNQVFQNPISKNKYYHTRYPKWARIEHWKLFQVSWLRLMTPTEHLRGALNSMLAAICRAMYDEYHVWEILNNSSCCNHTSSAPTMTTGSNVCDNSSCIVFMNSKCCKTKAKNIQPPECKNWNCSRPSVSAANCKACKTHLTDKTVCSNSTCARNVTDQLGSKIDLQCVNYLKANIAKEPDKTRMNHFGEKFCSTPYPILKPSISVEQIHKLKGYDMVDLNLVCVHIRLGRSATLSFDPVRNKADTLKVVWDFLKPYLAKGFHVYLATDAQEARDQAKKIFGDRVHFSNEEIVHIATVLKNQDKAGGMRFAAMEQLLLATSCKVLVTSKSGFSIRAASIRNELGNHGELFRFHNGRVVGKSPKWL